ncbi:hypothetical protein B0H11DRAFT_2024460 [Mycena galericulata]|nr:hypothetical protein B0H11DRAFT_2024460 [Mycena galericulata]
MSSFLTLFCCCGRHGARSDNEIDETTHLIPSNLDSAPPTVVFADHHQRIQERLITIVRAKERKMVNINSQIPFNLHNRVITPNPSLSRSVSLSTGPRDYGSVAPPSMEPLTVQLRSHPSPLPRGSGRDASQSKSRSLSLSRNRPDADPPSPILNVRLVNANLPQRVGRPRHRAFSSHSSPERPKIVETHSPDVEDVSTSDEPSSWKQALAVSPPDVEPLDEICLSWGDSDT